MNGNPRPNYHESPQEVVRRTVNETVETLMDDPEVPAESRLDALKLLLVSTTQSINDRKEGEPEVDFMGEHLLNEINRQIEVMEDMHRRIEARRDEIYSGPKSFLLTDDDRHIEVTEDMYRSGFKSVLLTDDDLELPANQMIL